MVTAGPATCCHANETAPSTSLPVPLNWTKVPSITFKSAPGMTFGLVLPVDACERLLPHPAINPIRNYTGFLASIVWRHLKTQPLVTQHYSLTIFTSDFAVEFLLRQIPLLLHNAAISVAIQQIPDSGRMYRASLHSRHLISF